MDDPIFIVDTWEGQGLLDLPSLQANSVQYVICRLGCYSKLGGIAGNRKDAIFDQQWAALQANPWFRRGIYIPHNPWISADANLKWLVLNIPTDCSYIEIDVENARKFNYSPKQYAKDVLAYLAGIPRGGKLRVVIYTAEWFLSAVLSWPTNETYAWAEYPSALYPSDTVRMSWDDLRAKLKGFAGPLNATKVPGKLGEWQCVADKIILPGSAKPLDVSVSMVDRASLEYLFGGQQTVPDPIPQPTTKPAIPGPAYLMGPEECGQPWPWPEGKLDAYPAVTHTRGGKGTVRLSASWMAKLKSIMSAAQWKRTWTDQEGWHNGGDQGVVQEVYFQHNKVWITGQAGDGWLNVDTYSNGNSAPVKLNDPYRSGVMTVDYKVGGVKVSDLALPVVFISNPGETLRIDPTFVKYLQTVPFTCLVKTPGSSLNVRATPSVGAVLTTFPTNTQITIFELAKMPDGVWGRCTSDGSIPGWVALWWTDWSV